MKGRTNNWHLSGLGTPLLILGGWEDYEPVAIFLKTEGGILRGANLP